MGCGSSWDGRSSQAGPKKLIWLQEDRSHRDRERVNNMKMPLEQGCSRQISWRQLSSKGEEDFRSHYK